MENKCDDNDRGTKFSITKPYTHNMRRILLLAALFVALGASTSSAQYNNRDRENTRVIAESKVYTDDRGEYTWQTVERRVWIPERRTSGVFGIGSRTIPGHYETRTERIKSYRRDNDRNTRYGDQRTQRKGWEGKHPHGMPPGQRKKLENRRDDDRYDNRDDRYDRNDRYDNDRNDSKYKEKKRRGND
jgi:hypothetical protein